MTITQVYDQAQGTLLILGEGGAGKTTLLFQLALDLLQRAEQSDTEPIPIVLPLSTWTHKAQTLEQWLVETLGSKPYRLAPHMARKLIERNQLLPLLDGFNQVAEAERFSCARALSAYQRAHSLLSLVICSREKRSLEQAGVDFLDAVVTIEPLTAEQVDAYLRSVDGEGSHLRNAFSADPILYEFAKTPLMLCMLTLAVQHGATLSPSAEGPSWRRQLFSTYIEHMLKRNDLAHPYPAEKTQRWLRALARYMTRNHESEFYLEYLTYETALPSSTRFAYLLFVVSFAIVTTIPLALIVASQLYLSVDNILRAYAKGYAGFTNYFDAVKYLPDLALSSPFLLLLLFELLTLFFFCFPIYAFWPRSSRPTRRLLFWNVGPQLAKELKFHILFGAIAIVPIVWFMSGPISAVASGLLLPTVLFLTHPIPKAFEKDTLTRPNQGVWHDLLQGICYGGVSGLFLGLLTGLVVWSEKGLSWGLSIGCPVGLLVLCLIGFPYGGSTFLRHFFLRLVLWGHFPLNIPRFLHYAETCLLLRRIGGGYSFPHPLFQEYFAAQDTASTAPAGELQSSPSSANKRTLSHRRASASLKRKRKQMARLRKPSP